MHVNIYTYAYMYIYKYIFNLHTYIFEDNIHFLGAAVVSGFSCGHIRQHTRKHAYGQTNKHTHTHAQRETETDTHIRMHTTTHKSTHTITSRHPPLCNNQGWMYHQTGPGPLTCAAFPEQTPGRGSPDTSSPSS